MATITNQMLRLGGSPGELQGSEATLVVDAPSGGSVRGVLHADPALLIALVAVVAFGVVGMALYVVQLAIRRAK